MLLDCDVYHKMLRGAVAFGEDFEQNYMKEIFSLQKGMTQAISHFSRHADANVKVQENGKYFYCGNDAKNALSKIRRFYVVSIGALVVIAILLFVATAHFGHPIQMVPDTHGSELQKAPPHAQ